MPFYETVILVFRIYHLLFRVSTIPQFKHGHVKINPNLSFPQAKRVGNPSDSPLEKGDEGGCLRKIPDKPE
jgi:hypothetical protein